MRLEDVKQYLALSPQQLADTIIKCPYCHKEHIIPFREIHSQPGSIQALPDIAHRCLGGKPSHIGVIFDKKIEHIIEANFLPSIKTSGAFIYIYALGDGINLLEPTDMEGERAVKLIDPKVQILIGIGSGVICDLTKYIADRTNLPFIICGTALSMNAYTSITGVITENKYKVSKFLKVCDSVILDPQVLAEAPVEMTLAGIGDLAARSICNADFKLSHLLNHTWFCPLPFQLTAPYEEQYFKLAADLGKPELNAIATFANANLISGYSMTMVDGETFPSSGAEHVISHFLDLQHELFGAPSNLHGKQVGIGTMINHALYLFLRDFNPEDIHIAQIIKRRPSLKQIQQENIQKFGESGEHLNQVVSKKYLDDVQLNKRLTYIKTNWGQFWNEIEIYITSPKTVHQCFRDAGVPVSLGSIHRTKDELMDAILLSNRYRARYTILDLLWEMGLFPEAAPDIFSLSGVIE